MISFVLLSLVACIPASYKPYHGHKVLRFEVKNEDQISLLKNLVRTNRLDVWSDIKIGFTDIRVPPSALPHIYAASSDIFSTVMIPNLQTLIDQEKAVTTIDNINGNLDAAVIFANYQDAKTYQKYLSSLHGTSTFSIGKTFGGSDIPGVKFGTGNRTIVFNGGIHAREWISPAVVTYVADFLLSSDPKAIKYRSLYTFYVIPVLNIDGYAYTRDPNGDRMNRKNREPNSGSDCVGTDPNRNFDNAWGGPGASSDPCADDFHGPSAGSSHESSAISAFVAGLSNVVSYYDIHSYSQLWMFAYGSDCDKQIPEFDDLTNASNQAVAAVKTVDGKVFAAGQICNTIYQASGTSVDYMYSLGIKYSATVELRDTGRYGFNYRLT